MSENSKTDPYLVKMPQLSDTMTEGILVSWEKEIGASVSRGDIVATVETDKAIMDVEVFRDGFLSGPMVEIGDTVAVGGTIATIVADESAITNNQASSALSVETGSESNVTELASEPLVTDSGSVNSSDNDVIAPEGVVTMVKMPQLSDTMTEGVVVSWEKSIGDQIKRGDIVAQVETDKAIMDVEVFKDGYLSGPQAQADSVVLVGGLMAYLVESAENVIDQAASSNSNVSPKASSTSSVGSQVAASSSSATAAISPSSSSQPVKRPSGKHVSPYALKLAGQMNIDIHQVSGTGPGGAITSKDVRDGQQQTRATVHAGYETPVPGDGRPMSGMERAVSHSMASSLTMPTFNVTVNAKPDALIKASKAKGVSVTVAIAKACALAMAKHPVMNWAYQPTDKIVERSNVDVGMAVAADGGGLVVPILRNCESESLESLNTSWKDLVGRARKRRLKPEEYANPTFMVSNMGMLGVTYFDAIPTPGTAAILAISSAGAEGMPLTITADHRVANGAEVAMYLNTLKALIQEPDNWIGPTGPAIPAGKWDYDVVVIGGGPGGEDCARDLAAHGVKVALVNDSPFPGGECLWRGCIPSKAWRAAADRIKDRANDARLGVEGTNEATLNWKALEKTRRGVLETRGELALKTDKGVKIKVLHGYAKFVNDHTIFVDQSNLQKDPHHRSGPGSEKSSKTKKGETISFGCSVIATGAPPFVPPIPGVDEGLGNGSVLTSDTVWFLDEAPRRLGVIGGGAIGLEMAQIFQDFGAKVTLLEAQDRILAEVETEIATHLTKILNEEPRLTIHTKAMVKSIKGEPGNVKVAYQDEEGKQRSFSCDYLILATGKRPHLDPLDLDKAGVAVDKGVITANTRSKTSVPHIFAVGDVVGGLMLAHTAGQQGRVAASSILGENLVYNQDKDSGVIFSRPQAAFVGLSLEQAKTKGFDAVEVKMPMSIDAKAMITNETHGMIKIVADKQSHKIIGVHFLADHADTLIGQGVMMVAGELTLEQVAEAIHPHPTQTEMFGEMARRLLSRLRRSLKAKRK